MPNLCAIGFAYRGVIEPLRCDTHVFEGKVNRVQNAVGADLKDHLAVRLAAEVATRGYIEVFPKIVADRMFRFRPILERPGNYRCAKCCMEGLRRGVRE